MNKKIQNKKKKKNKEQLMNEYIKSNKVIIRSLEYIMDFGEFNAKIDYSLN